MGYHFFFLKLLSTLTNEQVTGSLQAATELAKLWFVAEEPFFFLDREFFLFPMPPVCGTRPFFPSF